VLAGCGKPAPPKVTPYSVKVARVSPLAVDLALELDVENPNGIPLILNEVSGTLTLAGGIEVGKARATPKGDIPAHATRRIEATLSIPWANLPALAPLAASGKPVPYVLEGRAELGTDKLHFDVPYRVKGELRDRELIPAGLRGLGLP